MGSVADAPLTFFAHPMSWFAHRVRISLEEKGIAYKLIDVDFANKPELLLEANPIWKKIPTIIHNGKPVAESLVILEYLEDEWPQQVPLMPRDAHQKSQVRFWADYIYKSSGNLMKAAIATAGSPEQKAALEESVKFLKTLDTAMTSFSTEGPFFTGETFGFLDVVVGPLKNLILLAEETTGIALPGPDEIPRFHKCVEAIVARPSYKLVVPLKQDFIASFEARRKATAAASAAAVSK